MDPNENNDNYNSLLSIHYPGVVKNVSKMLETLGGEKSISSGQQIGKSYLFRERNMRQNICDIFHGSKTLRNSQAEIYSEKNRRLELRFRPNDAFCKPTYGSRKPVTGLLLKIKFRKNKKENKIQFISYQIVGSVVEEYKFSNLCDFQFLTSSTDKFLYNEIVPQGLKHDWLETESPYFLPPAAFSRVDTIQNFNFSRLPLEENKSNVIGRLKRKRYGCTKCLMFDNPEVPTLPKDVPKGGFHSAKIVANETLEHLNKLFQERPIYSKSAIKCISKVPLIQLKCLLPCVAYYFINGPWRSLWVRFGYDPRKDPSARIYQTLDYRVRSHLSKEEVKIKRINAGGPLSYKFSNQTSKNVTLLSKNLTDTSDKEEKSEQEDCYIFKPEMIPPSRQCYYQYCDIHVPEVKALLDNLDAVEENAVCHELDGWMPSTMADMCRDIMNKYVSEEVRRRNKLASEQSNSSIAENQKSYSSGSESDLTDSEQN